MKFNSIIVVLAIIGMVMWMMWPVETLYLADDEVQHPLRDCISIARFEAAEGYAAVIKQLGAQAPSQQYIADCRGEMAQAGISLDLPR